MEISTQRVKEYIEFVFRKHVAISSISKLAFSTRAAPWLIESVVESTPRKFVLRIDADISEMEIRVMQAVSACSDLPVPEVYGWDDYARFFDQPSFFYDYLDGDSLLQPLLANEDWAIKCYLDTVIKMNGISKEELNRSGCTFEDPYTCIDILQEDRAFFNEHDCQIAERSYQWLIAHVPEFPIPLFSNGDLWLDNILVKEEQVVGLIDFEHAGFSDPIFEFLLPFFNEPRLRGRGIEEKYCKRLGVDLKILDWYHGLEYLDTLRYVMRDGKPFNQYSEEVLKHKLEEWLAAMEGI